MFIIVFSRYIKCKIKKKSSRFWHKIKPMLTLMFFLHTDSWNDVRWLWPEHHQGLNASHPQWPDVGRSWFATRKTSSPRHQLLDRTSRKFSPHNQQWWRPIQIDAHTHLLTSHIIHSRFIDTLATSAEPPQDDTGQ